MPMPMQPPGRWLAAPQTRLGEVKPTVGSEWDGEWPRHPLLAFAPRVCLHGLLLRVYITCDDCSSLYSSISFTTFFLKKRHINSLFVSFFSCYQAVLLYALLFFSLMLLQKYLCDLYNDEWMMIWLILMVTWCW